VPLTEAQNARIAETAVGAQGDMDRGKTRAKQAQRAPQQREQPMMGGGVSGTQQGGEETLLSVRSGDVEQEGQVAVRIVVGVEELELLLPVTGIGGGVHVECHLFGVLRQQGDRRPSEGVGGPHQFPIADAVLQSGETGLAGQRLSGDG
jgi:hypothetical protein